MAQKPRGKLTNDTFECNHFFRRISVFQIIHVEIRLNNTNRKLFTHCQCNLFTTKNNFFRFQMEYIVNNKVK